MMENEPLAPYDENKLSNHKLSIAKPQKNMSRSYKGIYSQESM
jgi:hypothetical protein